MSNHSYQWAAALLATFMSCNSSAEVVVHEPMRVLSVNVASVDTSGDYGSSNGVQEAALEYASATGYAIAWGIEDRNTRFMLEYYLSQANVESPPFAVENGQSQLEVHSLFYSGYWVPDIIWGVRGILGAGIGYSEQTLSNMQLGELSDRGWSFKASAGLEYAVLPNFSVYTLAEGLFHDDIEDSVSVQAEDMASTGVADRSLSGSQQLRIAVGINFRY